LEAAWYGAEPWVLHGANRPVTLRATDENKVGCAADVVITDLKLIGLPLIRYELTMNRLQEETVK
jgi:hypothetical protein